MQFWPDPADIEVSCRDIMQRGAAVDQVRDPLDRLLLRHPELAGDAQREQRVAHVHAPGDGEMHLAPLPAPAGGAVRLDADPLRAVVGAEVDLSIGPLAAAVCDGGNLLQFPGVTLADGRRSQVAPPLRNLNSIPTPDFTEMEVDYVRVWEVTQP